jgi:hypothetical protein
MHVISATNEPIAPPKTFSAPAKVTLWLAKTFFVSAKTLSQATNSFPKSAKTLAVSGKGSGAQLFPPLVTAETKSKEEMTVFCSSKEVARSLRARAPGRESSRRAFCSFRVNRIRIRTKRKQDDGGGG